MAVTLFGMLADEGRMALDEPLGFDWLPRGTSPETDPRNAITLRHLLNMSSGLYPVDNAGLEYATGSGMAYWAGASSVRGALHRGSVQRARHLVGLRELRHAPRRLRHEARPR